MKVLIQLLLITFIFSSIGVAQDYNVELKNIQDTIKSQDQQVQSKSSRNQTSDMKARMDLIKKRINIVRETFQKIQIKATDCSKNPDPKIKKDCQVSIRNKIAEMKAELASIDVELKKLR